MESKCPDSDFIGDSHLTIHNQCQQKETVDVNETHLTIHNQCQQKETVDVNQTLLLSGGIGKDVVVAISGKDILLEDTAREMKSSADQVAEPFHSGQQEHCHADSECNQEMSYLSSSVKIEIAKEEKEIKGYSCSANGQKSCLKSFSPERLEEGPQNLNEKVHFASPLVEYYEYLASQSTCTQSTQGLFDVDEEMSFDLEPSDQEVKLLNKSAGKGQVIGKLSYPKDIAIPEIGVLGPNGDCPCQTMESAKEEAVDQISDKGDAGKISGIEQNEEITQDSWLPKSTYSSDHISSVMKDVHCILKNIVDACVKVDSALPQRLCTECDRQREENSEKEVGKDALQFPEYTAEVQSSLGAQNRGIEAQEAIHNIQNKAEWKPLEEEQKCKYLSCEMENITKEVELQVVAYTIDCRREEIEMEFVENMPQYQERRDTVEQTISKQSPVDVQTEGISSLCKQENAGEISFTKEDSTKFHSEMEDEQPCFQSIPDGGKIEAVNPVSRAQNLLLPSCQSEYTMEPTDVKQCATEMKIKTTENLLETVTDLQSGKTVIGLLDVFESKEMGFNQLQDSKVPNKHEIEGEFSPDDLENDLLCKEMDVFDKDELTKKIVFDKGAKLEGEICGSDKPVDIGKEMLQDLEKDDSEKVALEENHTVIGTPENKTEKKIEKAVKDEQKKEIDVGNRLSEVSPEVDETETQQRIGKEINDMSKEDNVVNYMCGADKLVIVERAMDMNVQDSVKRGMDYIDKRNDKRRKGCAYESKFERGVDSNEQDDLEAGKYNTEPKEVARGVNDVDKDNIGESKLIETNLKEETLEEVCDVGKLENVGKDTEMDKSDEQNLVGKEMLKFADKKEAEKEVNDDKWNKVDKKMFEVVSQSKAENDTEGNEKEDLEENRDDADEHIRVDKETMVNGEEIDVERAIDVANIHGEIGKGTNDTNRQIQVKKELNDPCTLKVAEKETAAINELNKEKKGTDVVDTLIKVKREIITVDKSDELETEMDLFLSLSPAVAKIPCPATLKSPELFHTDSEVLEEDKGNLSEIENTEVENHLLDGDENSIKQSPDRNVSQSCSQNNASSTPLLLHRRIEEEECMEKDLDKTDKDAAGYDAVDEDDDQVAPEKPKIDDSDNINKDFYIVSNQRKAVKDCDNKPVSESDISFDCDPAGTEKTEVYMLPGENEHVSFNAELHPYCEGLSNKSEVENNIISNNDKTMKRIGDDINLFANKETIIKKPKLLFKCSSLPDKSAFPDCSENTTEAAGDEVSEIVTDVSFINEDTSMSSVSKMKDLDSGTTPVLSSVKEISQDYEILRPLNKCTVNDLHICVEKDKKELGSSSYTTNRNATGSSEHILISANSSTITKYKADDFCDLGATFGVEGQEQQEHSPCIIQSSPGFITAYDYHSSQNSSQQSQSQEGSLGFAVDSLQQEVEDPSGLDECLTEGLCIDQMVPMETDDDEDGLTKKEAPMYEEVMVEGVKAQIYSCDQFVCDSEGNLVCRSLEKTEKNCVTDRKEKQGKGSGQIHHDRCFSWKYTPSCDLDAVVPVPADAEDNDILRITPLKTCERPRRVGLSRRQKVHHHLHQVARSSLDF